MPLQRTTQARVGVASLMHESNSFNPEKTVWADFHMRAGDTPEATLRCWRADSSEVAGFLEAGSDAGLELLPILHAAATPKGPVDLAAFERLAQRLLSGLTAALPLDGMLLALHGAMYVEEYPHADEELIRRVRSVLGSAVPLVVTHDFHANIPPSLAELTDALVVYQQNPHVDTKERGRRAADILARILRREVRPRQVISKPPMLWNIIFQNTFAEPLKSITQASMELEREPSILAASVAGGYQYNDTPHMGPAVVVVTNDDPALAQREADRLAAAMGQRRDRLHLNLPDPAAAVQQAMAADALPIALFDAGDNIGGGAAGDSTAILSELLRQKACGWVFVLFDPAAVAAAKAAGIDGVFENLVGSPPVPVRGRVRSLHHGRYVEPEVRHGGRRYWDMGHAAVIEEAGSSPDALNLLVLTSLRSTPDSLRQLVSCGIDPRAQKILVAKGTVAPRAAYEPVSAGIVVVDSPGYTGVNPARFRFRRARAEIVGPS